MNLDLLTYFYETAKASNMTRAAQKRRVSQSAISRAIQKLEAELGVQLITHTKRHLQLTEAGEIVFEESAEIFEAVAHLRESLLDFKSELAGPLRLGCSDSFASTLLLPALDAYRNRYPKVEPSIALGGSDDVRRLVLEQTIDMGIIVDQGNLGSFRKTKLLTTHFCVVCAAGTEETQMLQRLIIARLAKESFSRLFMAEYERRNGVRLRPHLLLPSWLVCKAYAIAGVGAAILPRFVVEAELARGDLHEIVTNVPMMSVDLCAITLRGRTVPRNGAALIELMAHAAGPQA